MRLKKDKCLACGTVIDCASGVTTESKPKPGDITICLYCGHLMAFDNELMVRTLTDAEMLEVAGNKDILEIQRVRGEVMKHRRSWSAPSTPAR